AAERRLRACVGRLLPSGCGPRAAASRRAYPHLVRVPRRAVDPTGRRRGLDRRWGTEWRTGEGTSARAAGPRCGRALAWPGEGHGMADRGADLRSTTDASHDDAELIADLEEEKT